MMIKAVIVSLSLIFAMSAYSQPDVELRYSDLKISLPSKFTLIGDAGGSDNILIIRYGKEKGRKFIAFTDMTNDESIEFGCPVNVFFQDLFSGSGATNCNEKNLGIFRETFITNKDVEVWAIGSYVVNYSGGKDKSFAFISDKNGKLVKIDSDFLSKDDYKKLLKGI